jgi:hypothetical protein
MRKYFFLFFIYTLFTVQANAQENVKKSKQEYGLIIGNVMDATTSKPISYATVSLITSNDTAKRFIQIADKNGAFEFEKVPFAVYTLYVTIMGYKNLTLDSINVRAERFDFNLGDVKLTAASSDLTEVIVYSEKPLIENRDGKLIYNVGESALSNGSSTAEILKSMPLINNDPNGKILLKGKEPKILIDDKPTDLTTEQLKDLLESLPGSSIEKIELMVNPPPEYATESGGVINIVTKKGKVGLTGKVTINGGTRGDGNLAANISYRKQKVSYTTTFGIGGSVLTGNSYSRRQSFYTDSSNKFNTDGNYKNKNLRPNLRFQVDYEINKFRNISFTYQGNINLYHNYSVTQYTNINRFDEAYKFSSRENDTEGDGYSHGLTLGYTIKGKKTPGETVRFVLNGNIGKNDNDRDFFQQFVASNLMPYSDSSQNQFANVFNNSFSARVNYDKPINKLIFFSTGATFQRSNFHSTLNTSFLRKVDTTYIPNDLLSNDFKFHQNIATARVAATITLPQDWKIIAGVQAELSKMNFEFYKGNSTDVANDYINVLPTITIRKEFNKQVNTALVYRATIRRPGLGELNPNIDYSDPYNLRFGNPFLLPTLADNYDWNFSVIKSKFYINTSLGYNKIKNIFNTIRTLNTDGKTQTTWQNIADRNEYEASIWGGYTFSKKVRMNASAGYSYNQYGEAEKLLYKYIDGSTFYTGLNYNYTPTTTLTFDGNARYSSFATPQGRSRSSLSMNLGVQKKFFNKRLIVAFNIIDPFLVQQSTNYTYGINYTIESFSSANTRNFRLSISYQLNKMVQKSNLSDKQKKALLEKLQQKKNNQ